MTDISDPDGYAPNYAEKPAETAAAPAGDDPDAEIDHEGFGMSDVLLDSVTKDEWKSIEASLSHHKKTVAVMLQRACSQVRTKGELILDESNGKFLGDMLPEMENFSTWCYKVTREAGAAACASAHTHAPLRSAVAGARAPQDYRFASGRPGSGGRRGGG